MKADAARLGTIKVEGLNRFPDVRAQFVPSVTLSENAFAKTLGAKPAVGFLRHLENNVVHPLNLSHFKALRKYQPRLS
jgi:hypothetical protein